jgi:UDP-N-acetylmuramyl pentapeptide synthase
VSIDSRTLPAGRPVRRAARRAFRRPRLRRGGVERGAVAAVVERDLGLPVPQLVAPDSLAALSAAAPPGARRFDIPVVGVAGSNGKTTTKELSPRSSPGAGRCSPRAATSTTTSACR